MECRFVYHVMRKTKEKRAKNLQHREIEGLPPRFQVCNENVHERIHAARPPDANLIKSHNGNRVPKEADALNLDHYLISFLKCESVRWHNPGAGKQNRAVGENLRTKKKPSQFLE